jgi:hypothetical protein
MATDRPRITVTITPATHAVLRRMSALTKNSQSAIVGDLLEQAGPVLDRMVRVLELAATVQRDGAKEVLDGLKGAMDVMDKQLGLLHTDVDVRVTDMVDHMEKVARKRGRGWRSQGAAPVPLPPSSNRGGAIPRKKTKTSSRRVGGRRG